MKGIYVIAFLASCTVSATNFDQFTRSVSKEEHSYMDGIPTTCPFSEKYTTNLPHETDCTKFYKCFLGRRIFQECPLITEGDSVTRLHYNRFLQTCDWPWQAGCDSCSKSYPNGMYQKYKISYESNCDQYYECINGVEYSCTCPPGTCFSRTCQKCVVNRDGGNCSPIPSSLPHDDLPCDKIPHECSCTKYYTCHGNDMIVVECEGGLHFSPTKKMCLPPNLAGCILAKSNKKFY